MKKGAYEHERNERTGGLHGLLQPQHGHGRTGDAKQLSAGNERDYEFLGRPLCLLPKRGGYSARVGVAIAVCLLRRKKPEKYEGGLSNMKKLYLYRMRRCFRVRRCRFCGYSGGGWPDSGECPSCGEVN